MYYLPTSSSLYCRIFLFISLKNKIKQWTKYLKSKIKHWTKIKRKQNTKTNNKQQCKWIQKKRKLNTSVDIKKRAIKKERKISFKDSFGMNLFSTSNDFKYLSAIRFWTNLIQMNLMRADYQQQYRLFGKEWCSFVTSIK